ncbi:MAG: alkane 1-monooxygenase [Ferruginibacter sp.]|nr:alkane 1-monooxygenase [Ferruginibacter sp.]
MRLPAIKYVSPVSVYLLALVSFISHGWLCWLPLLYAWVILPISELLIRTDEKNLSVAEEELAKNDRVYDYVLYGFVGLQYAALCIFLLTVSSEHWTGWELAGKIGTMGLLCGTFGINIGHELGHRSAKKEQLLAKAALLTSLYLHFFIEHNRGHHRHVATPNDPSSARYNEPVYLFYFRTIIFSYLSAWKIANADMHKKELPAMHLKNEMIQAHLVQLLFVTVIWLFFGFTVTIYFGLAALIGILLLETVNYIEHYGLQRKQTGAYQYERALPVHSWNSDHVLGRIMLFELSRHSDHHFLASKKYQLLKSHASAPQLPTGYPGSMILSLVPPLWFHIMNRRIKQLHRSVNDPVSEGSLKQV